MFLNIDLFGDGDSVHDNKIVAKPSSFSIKNGIFDEAFLSSDVTRYNSDSYDWDSDVLIFATFDSKTLEGGNIGTLANKLQSVQIRRREAGAKNWTILTAYPIPDTDHLNFSFADYFARGRNTKYEYSVNYILRDGTELPYISASVVSNFCGAVISDATKSYHVFLDPSITSTTRNRQANVVTTLNSRYPYVFFGSNSNYDSGNFSGTIIKNEDGDYWDFDGSYKYREEMKDWLTNGEPKILKIEDGREWMISVNGNVDEDSSEHRDKVKLSFDFVQIGDHNSSDDLASNGLTTYNDMEYSTYYSVTENLISTNNSSHIISVKQGDSYSAKLAAFEGYVLNSVSVSMNGISITASAYNESTHEITIPTITGDIIISAVSVKLKIDKIALNYSNLILSKNDKRRLTLVYSPTDAKIGDITWKSSNPDVVIVANGMVQGLKAGSSVVTASVDGLEVSCNVNIISLADTAGVSLSIFKEGAAIHIRENSSPTYYIVAKHNYEKDLNGEGRTLIIRKTEYVQMKWNASGTNAYSGSDIDKELTSTLLNSYDTSIVNVLNDYPTKIPYTPSNGSSNVSTLTRTVFLPSATEYGPQSAEHNIEGATLPTAMQLLSSGCTGNKALMTRTPAVYNSSNKKDSVIVVYYNASENSFESRTEKCTDYADPDNNAIFVAHPALTLPESIKIIIDNPIKASSVSLSKTSAVIHIGEELNLNASYLPLDATYPLINYCSDNPFVASVSSGVVKGIAVGYTTITVYVDSTYATCDVRVVE